MALEREGFEQLLEVAKVFQRKEDTPQTQAELNAVIASFEAQFGGTLSAEQRGALFGEAQLTEEQLTTLPERTEEVAQRVEQGLEQQRIETEKRETIQKQNLIVGRLANTFEGDAIEFVQNVVNQLGPALLPLIPDIGTGSLAEQAQIKKLVAVLRESVDLGEAPSDAINRIQQVITSKQTVELQQQFLGALEEQRTKFETQQGLEQAFTGAGGLATPQALAQLSGATTLEEALSIAQESIATEEGLEQERIQQFQTERGALSEELAGIGGRELELAQPEIEKRLQALGILRGGEQIKQTQEGAERLESERQRILAGFGREDILQARGLSEQFSQQARGLALQERGEIAGGLQGVLSTQLGAQRTDITGARAFQQQQGLLSTQLGAESRAANLQRIFQGEQAALTRENEIRKAIISAGGGSGGGNIFGGVAGAIGSFIGGKAGGSGGAKIGKEAGLLAGFL